MTELSPAAQAVLDAAVDAYGSNYSWFHCCADRVWECDADELLAIASELEAQ